MIRVFLELIRIIAIISILGKLMGTLVNSIYSGLDINVENTNGSWLVGISILLIFFVLYRNKLQFSGFYKGNGIVKLPKMVSVFLISCSILFIIIAPLFR